MAPRRADASLETRLEALQYMKRSLLCREWRRCFQAEPPPRLGRDLLARCIAYALQEAAFGGLPAATRRRLAALADGGVADRQQTATLRPGAMLVRSWNGETHTVQVLADGYEHQGQLYRSLSHIARTITGTRWSGPRFFGLTNSPTVDDDA